MFGFLRRRGNRAEDAASEHLARHGYTVLERNVSIGGGELDIVAEDGDTLVMVEVKARSDDGLGSPEEAITAAKALRIARATRAYVQSRRLPDRCVRVDLAAVALGPDGEPLRVEILEDILDVEAALRGGAWRR